MEPVDQQLTGKQQQQLERILLDAYPRKTDLARMVRHGLDESIDELTSGGALRDIVFELIEWTRSQYKIPLLLRAALEANTDNPQLREFVAQLGGTPPPSANNNPAKPGLSWQARRDLLFLLQKTLHTTDQLRIFCVILGVSYATLEGTDLEMRIASLLGSMEQQGRITELSAAAHDEAQRQGQAAQAAAERPNKVRESLVAAIATTTNSSPETSPEDQVRQITNAVNQIVQPSAARRLAGALVLWVDDHPANNVYERRALEPLGVRFMLSSSTEDALEKLKHNTFDAIISDMGRPPDPYAGYTLLQAMRDAKITTPFIIYAGLGVMKPEHQAESRRKGAFGSTANPTDLFQLTVSAILGGAI